MKKKMIAIGILTAVLVGTVNPVSAAGVCWCIQAGQAAGVVSYECNQTKYAGPDDSHGYGFFWQNTCTILTYLSDSREYCNKCDYTYRWCGSHECAVRHKDCGKGYMNTCAVMGMTPGDAQNPHSENVETE